jgi:uncharacterized lipoprotein YmbA
MKRGNGFSRSVMATAVIIVATLAGCAGSAPKATYLALPSVAASAAASGTPVQSRAIVLRRIAVPEYIDSREVRYRAANSEITSFPNTLWAERMELGMTRELTAGMRNRVPDWLVCNGTCGDRRVDAVLSVDWSTLDLDRSSHRLSVDAQWVLIDNTAKPGQPSPNGRLVRTITLAGDGADDYAAAIAAAVDQLAADVTTQGLPKIGR